MKLKTWVVAVVTWALLALPSFSQTAIKIAAGSGHSLFLKSDGSLWGMGDNGGGALGDGTFGDPYSITNKPEQIVASGVTTIAAGDGFSLFLKSDGSLWAMGDNSLGQLGDGTYSTSTSFPYGIATPEQIVASGVTAIAAGWTHSLFVKSDGSLWTMGCNFSGQLGDGMTSNRCSPVLVVPPASSAPIIIAQPHSQKSAAGKTIDFNMAAVGTSPLHYQWKLNGSPLADATNASLSLANVQFANAGGYSVVVANIHGSTNSAVAQMTVFSNLVVAQTDEAPPPPGNSTIPTDTIHFKVFQNSGFVTGVALDPSKSTIVLTHGWNDSSSGWPLEMANDIKFELGSSTPNIVAWDWTMAAAQPLPAATLNTTT